jgi:flagellar assembly protein FliH
MAPRDVIPRSPGFLHRPQQEAGAIAPALFPRAERPVKAWPNATTPSREQEMDEAAAAAAAEAAAAAAAAEAARAEELALINGRLGVAVVELQATAERLASEARTDALEIAFFLARRILEVELGASVESMAALARSAVRRLGESRRIELRLCPADAEAIKALLAARGQSALTSQASAHIEVMPDQSLERGDCVVVGEAGTVDGRLDTRLDELRRALAEDVGEPS